MQQLHPREMYSTSKNFDHGISGSQERMLLLQAQEYARAGLARNSIDRCPQQSQIARGATARPHPIAYSTWQVVLAAGHEF